MSEATSSTPASTEHDAPPVSWFELFFDLVIVAAVSQAGKVYAKSPDWSTGALIASAISVLALAWLMTTLSYGLYRRESAVRRLVVVTEMFALLLSALAVGKYGIANWIGFGALGVAFLAIAFLYAGHEGWLRNHPLPNRTITLVSAAIGVLAIAASLPMVGATSPQSSWIAPLILTIIFLVIALPLLGPFLKAATLGNKLDVPHLKERLGLFVIIVLGEQFVSLVAFLGQKGSIPNPFGFLTSLLVAYAIWSLYFTDNFSLTPPKTIGALRLWLGMHLLLIFGCVSVAAMFSSITLTPLDTSQQEIGGEWTPIPVILVIAGILFLSVINGAARKFIYVQIAAIVALVLVAAVDISLGAHAPLIEAIGAVVLIADALIVGIFRRKNHLHTQALTN